MEKFEYKSITITFKNRKNEDSLVQNLGAEGWELVSFQARFILFMPIVFYAFKRKLSE